MRNYKWLPPWTEAPLFEGMVLGFVLVLIGFKDIVLAFLLFFICVALGLIKLLMSLPNGGEQ